MSHHFIEKKRKCLWEEILIHFYETNEDKNHKLQMENKNQE